MHLQAHARTLCYAQGDRHIIITGVDYYGLRAPVKGAPTSLLVSSRGREVVKKRRRPELGAPTEAFH